MQPPKANFVECTTQSAKALVRDANEKSKTKANLHLLTFLCATQMNSLSIVQNVRTSSNCSTKFEKISLKNF